MHEELLTEVTSDWTASRVLPGLVRLLRDVWRTNIDRHEPELGDDAVTLGLGSSRNFANRVVRAFLPHDRVVADLQSNSLRVVHLGRTLRASKLPGKSVHADPHDISWDTSATKQRGPAANSYQQLGLFELPAEEQLANAEPGLPKHLHLAWAGDAETGDIAVYLGFPRDNADGGSPWLAVRLVHRDEPGEQLTVVPMPGYDMDRFDQRPAPQIAVRLRGVNEQESVTDDA